MMLPRAGDSGGVVLERLATPPASYKQAGAGQTIPVQQVTQNLGSGLSGQQKVKHSPGSNGSGPADSWAPRAAVRAKARKTIFFFISGSPLKRSQS
jgi:hypothetical protein